jgi:hypothetical protein
LSKEWQRNISIDAHKNKMPFHHLLKELDEMPPCFLYSYDSDAWILLAIGCFWNINPDADILPHGMIDLLIESLRFFILCVKS